jgi:hypothetical protein
LVRQPGWASRFQPPHDGSLDDLQRFTTLLKAFNTRTE